MSILSISDEYYDTIENQEPITPALSKFNLMLSVGVACPSFFPEYGFPPGGVRTTIAKHHGRYSKPDHLCQDGVE